MCAAVGITHLAYLDDLLLFAKGVESTITLMADYLKDFVDVSGSRLNLNKSNIYFTGLDHRTWTRLLDITEFQQGTFPFSYLGILWQ